MPRLGSTDLDVHPLNLGGNVFGWTADEPRSFAVLDAYHAAGGNFVDTADSYSAWVPGHQGGESEDIVGRWMVSRGTREEMVIATKVGMWQRRPGLGAETIRAAAEDSLRRLQTDRIDLYYAHEDDPDTPQEETLGAFDALVREGKVRHVAASNFTADRLRTSLAISDRDGLARYVALQPKYNLVERAGYEGGLQDLCAAEGLACVPYSALASGFLTGKYRPDGPAVDSARSPAAAQYLDDRGRRVLAALDEVAAARDAPIAAVALAWLRAQPTVVAPVASARTADQLPDLLRGAVLKLTQEEAGVLSAASA